MLCLTFPVIQWKSLQKKLKSKLKISVSLKVIRNGKSGNTLFPPQTRHEAWALSWNNYKVILKRKWDNDQTQINWKIIWTLQCLSVIKPRASTVLVKLISSRFQLEIPLHPCSTAICPITISSLWSTGIQNIFTSTKANFEMFSNHAVKKYFNIMLWGLFFLALFSLMLAFFHRNITFYNIRTFCHIKIRTFFPQICSDCILKSVLKYKNALSISHTQYKAYTWEDFEGNTARHWTALGEKHQLPHLVFHHLS